MNSNGSTESSKIVGQTSSAGFQIGVRRTLPISADQAWAFLTSPEGAKLWLGSTPPLEFAIRESFAASEGITGQFKVVKPQQQLQLRWQKPEWERPSTLQIRLLPAKSGTTISFHQEQLDHPGTREEMKLHWEAVLDTIKEQLNC
ncbi:ATPase [Bacillus sp. FJAT-27264]|uniref:SRPBCC family protein n=1 Tax=Paenibacillus sp. (strain DSM 101736 / FJAT-27264) TaxID=1850362 RepID=UPI000807B86E|nr:SRPBCC domain-containing protein [Bacillus sp. FJAT-27264]OBZ14923.1 ATPase [Bacillus sp. FJAT-27264]